MATETKEWIESAFTCGICSNTVSSPVRMTCEGEHLFCFGCIFDYYKARPASEINCPNCRHGNGSIVICNKLYRLLQVYNNTLPEENKFIASDTNEGTDEDTERPITTADYRRLFPSLKRRFPVAMENSMGSSVILSAQMGLFVRNYETLLAITGRTPPPPEGREWVDEEGEAIRRMPDAAPAVLPRVTLLSNQQHTPTPVAFSAFNAFRPVIHSPPRSTIDQAVARALSRTTVENRRERMITILTDLESLAVAANNGQ